MKRKLIRWAIIAAGAAAVVAFLAAAAGGSADAAPAPVTTTTRAVPFWTDLCDLQASSPCLASGRRVFGRAYHPSEISQQVHRIKEGTDSSRLAWPFTVERLNCLHTGDAVYRIRFHRTGHCLRVAGPSDGFDSSEGSCTFGAGDLWVNGAPGVYINVKQSDDYGHDVVLEGHGLNHEVTNNAQSDYHDQLWAITYNQGAVMVMLHG